MKKISLIAVVFFALLFASKVSVAQNNAPQKKEHFKFNNPNNEDALWFEKAITKASFDSLRFLNQRRTISIKGTSMSIELFSAQELKDTFGKPISALTIANPQAARKVKFTLGKSGLLEVVE